MKNPAKKTWTTEEARFTNEIGETQEGISGVEDPVEETDTSFKENVISKKFLILNIQEMRHYEKAKPKNNRNRGEFS